MFNESKKNISIIAIFILLIGLPVITLRWVGGDYSAAEKRILAPMPTLLQDDGSLNINAQSEIKDWFGDHIGFRDEFVFVNSYIRYNFFHQSPSAQVHIGKDGWFYYTLDNNLEIAIGAYPLSDETLAAILQNHLAVQKKLQAKGIDYVIVLPTSKVSIYPEFMRYGSGEVCVTPVDIVANYLENNSDLKVVRLKEELLEAKQTEQVYYKTDTHWNQYGAYVAYRKIIENMQQWGLCNTAPIDVDFVDAEYTGEFGAMLGIDLGAESTKNSLILNPQAIKNPETEKNSVFCNILEAEGISNPCHFYSNPAVTGKKVIMFGDSMFGSWNATELLAENFSEFTYIWDNGELKSSLIDYVQPDIVIFEFTERFLNSTPYKNTSFIKEALMDYDAQILSYEINENSLSVTVLNNSQSVWDNPNQIRCYILVDGVDQGLRALIEPLKTVMPGESYTFTFDNIDNLKNYDLEVQMLQEGITYFGEREKIEIIKE